MNLAGKNVVITGASQGLGEAIAVAFADQGCQVMAVARSEDRLAAVAKRVGGRYLVADLLSEPEVDGLVDCCIADFGHIDVWVNNAGVETSDAFVRVEPGDIRNLSRLNLEVPMMLTRYVLPHMLRRGSGQIVNMSSLAGTIPWPGLAAYCGSKAGLTNFSETLRLELRGSGVGVTVVAPGPVATDMWSRLDSDDKPYVAPAIRRFRQLGFLAKLEPETVATSVVKAVAEGKPWVRPAARYQGYHMLNNAPRRIVRAALTGVKLPLPRLEEEGSRDGARFSAAGEGASGRSDISERIEEILDDEMGKST
ncbi:MAG: SDR family NAD(P)-dependent oxidoreductase [Acidimicrobiales bacterium]